MLSRIYTHIYFSALVMMVFFCGTYFADANDPIAECGYELRYSCCNGGSKLVTSGNILARHNINLIGGYTPAGHPNTRVISCKGSVSVAYSPLVEFSANNGNWDTPFVYPCNNDGDCMGFYSGRGHSNTDYVQGICGQYKNNECVRNGYVAWQYNENDLSEIESLNIDWGADVISCTKQGCVAKKPGTARITITTKSLDPRIFAHIEYNNNEWVYITKYDSRSQRNLAYLEPKNPQCAVSNNAGAGDIRITIPSVTKTFWIIVEDCAPGECDPLTDGQVFEEAPTVNLCIDKGGDVIPKAGHEVSWNDSTERWEWICPGAEGGADSRVCWATKPPEKHGVCNSSVTMKFPYATEDWPSPSGLSDAYFCSSGEVLGLYPQFPEPGGEVEWTCEGNRYSSDHDDVVCRAEREVPSSACGSINNSQCESTPPNSGLCAALNTKISGVDYATDGTWDGVWRWVCAHEYFVNIGSASENGVNCQSRSCLADTPLNLQRYVYFDSNGDPQNASVTVNCPCPDPSNKVCCEIDGQLLDEGGTQKNFICTGESGEVEIAPGDQMFDARCWFEDDPGTEVEYDLPVSTMCTSRSCSSQGLCQAVPQPSSQADACKSTCNSDADCTKGRMIETRP